MDFFLNAFLKFMQDLPFAQIGAAVGADGLNVSLDIAAAEKIAAAAAKDFFDRTVVVPVADAPATTAAVADHVAANK